MEITTKSAKETKEFGRKISSDLKGGETIALSGDLGSGKTTFVQGLASGLGIENRIVSPTYIIMRRYKVPLVNILWGIKYLYHVDLYRLEGAVESELVNLGIKDVWGKKENAVVIEWADKATGIYPDKTSWLSFTSIGKNKRKIKTGKLKLQ